MGGTNYSPVIRNVAKYYIEENPKEIPTFVSCRVATGLMDLIIMFVCVDVLGLHAMLMKLLSNVLVIILNYLFSKFLIFRNR